MIICNSFGETIRNTIMVDWRLVFLYESTSEVSLLEGIIIENSLFWNSVLQTIELALPCLVDLQFTLFLSAEFCFHHEILVFETGWGLFDVINLMCAWSDAGIQINLRISSFCLAADDSHPSLKFCIIWPRQSLPLSSSFFLYHPPYFECDILNILMKLI